MLMKAVEKAFGFLTKWCSTLTRIHKSGEQSVVRLSDGHTATYQKKNMSGWLPDRARREYGQSDFAEVHAGHFHSESETQYRITDGTYGLTVRHLPTVCSASAWEHQQAYPTGNKTVVTYV